MNTITNTSCMMKLLIPAPVLRIRFSEQTVHGIRNSPVVAISFGSTKQDTFM
ncbi:MAG: hypothetical protein WAL29_15900 [Bacteroidales bacterium]